MFAVVVLGIGFIMVAAIFPVAIKQTQLNSEETIAAAVARNGLAVMTELATQPNPNYTDPGTPLPLGAPGNSMLPPTWIGGAAPNPADLPVGTTLRLGKIASMKDRRIPNAAPPTYSTAQGRRDGMWRAVAGNMVQPGDPRYAWTVLYRRDTIYSNVNGVGLTRASPFAQLILIGCAVRNRSTYEPWDYASPSTGAISDQQYFATEPKPIALRILPIPDASGQYYALVFSLRVIPGRGGFNFGAGNPDPMLDAIASDGVGEGSFLIISDDRIIDRSTGTIGESTGRMNGRIYRLGVRRPDLDEPGNPPRFAWTLQPGFDFIPDPGPDGVFYGNGGGGKLQDDINAIGIDGLPSSVAPPVSGTPTDGSDIAVSGPAAGKGAVAYVIGKGFATPNPNVPLPPGAANVNYEGTTQDVAIYTTYVPVR